MDDFERMMFRRRKQHIGESMQLTEDLLDDLRLVGLLNGDVIAMIQVFNWAFSIDVIDSTCNARPCSV
jgi:hypothetical protein